MGDHDHVRPALEALGCELHFWGVAIKPGFPVVFGSFGGPERPGLPLVFGLPGNPVSCLLDHEVFVRPALDRMEGAIEEEPALRLGRWEGKAPRTNARQQNLPVTVAQDTNGVDVLTPIGWSSSAQTPSAVPPSAVNR